MCVGRKFGVRWCVAKRYKFSKASTANSLWQTFAGKTAHSKFERGKCGEMGGACKQSRQSKNGAVWAGDVSLSLSLSLSLVARTFWHAFVLNLQGFSHTHILKHKFNFFTQNSTHFIFLSQISSLTQGFFISLSQIFAQFLLINSTQRKYYGRT